MRREPLLVLGDAGSVFLRRSAEKEAGWMRDGLENRISSEEQGGGGARGQKVTVAVGGFIVRDDF